LITLIHEISHLVAFEKFGRNIKTSVMNGSIPTVNDSLYIRPEIFQVNCFLYWTFQNPTASSDTDTTLSLALKQFDAQNDKNYIFEIPYGVFQDR
jgi:hypothetical protein